MNIQFRVAGLADAPALLELMREYYAFDHLSFDESAARPALEGLLQNAAFGRAWLIEGTARRWATSPSRWATAWSTMAATPSSTSCISASPIAGAGSAGGRWRCSKRPAAS